METINKKLGLYIHIPFCKSKCHYCDFYSLTDYNDKFKKLYIDSLLLHMEDYARSAKPYTIDTIYIGGGTPSSLPCNDLLDLIDGIYFNFNVSADAEFTIEVNPGTADHSTFKKLFKSGVNRISFGMQSSCDNELQALARIHNFEDFENSYEAARRAGFENINIDVMFGIPEQTPSSLRTTLERICALEPEHISLYGLKIEENTPFAQIIDSLNLPEEDEEVNMYFESVKYLELQGYEQYEISNFSKSGKQCLHNLKYWNCEDYLGLGPSAHSYYNGYRFSFKTDVEMYIEALKNVDQDFDIIDEYYEISVSERIGEYIMLRMRLNEGINTDKFFELFGLEFDKLYGKYMDNYKNEGYIIKKGKNYSFTVHGMYLSNYILASMLDFDEKSVSKILNGVN
ncbi:MAG: radical SAM family heme chaperone HemW [Oscillospiraceae bacterium]|nr:radical SAM family heme chaperone HemW [Oscillospiraceae bacterium]